MTDYYFSSEGTCPACEQKAMFRATTDNFRNTLKCSTCGSGPRQCALMHAIKTLFPQWRKLAIHESSAGWDMIAQRMAKECQSYTVSQFDPTVARGTKVHAPRMPAGVYQSEDLERQTFPEAAFDLVLTQDVFEHIFRPDLAIKEIARTLKPNGATIMSVPIVRGRNPSVRRARMTDGIVENILPAEFHGNPVNKEGAIVTIDWGYDIVSYLQTHSGMSFAMLKYENPSMGIMGPLNEVIVGFKQKVPDLS